MTDVTVSLDLRGVRCPMNYIKTKLKLDELAAGEMLEVFIDDGEAVRGLPTGLRDEGHEILVTEPVHPGCRVVIKKGTGDKRQETGDRKDAIRNPSVSGL